MSMIVIMPGGFHPFHAGHASLYQSALKAFPNADVYVAATNDTKTRPFPFEIKEKLAKVAGVAPGRFVQVKSPFQAKEITQNYDPEKDVLVFVRSEKDRDEQPKPGGTKKDGSPAYFQPYTGKNLQPFGKHGYIAYLPTVEFGPGIKSATEIRNLWPTLNDRRKLAMVMSLYPKAKENQRLAQNIVKMLDIGMGAGEEVSEGIFDRFKKKPTRDDFIRQKLAQMSTEELRSQLRDYKGRIPSARASGSLVGGAVSDYANAIQRELDKRSFNDFTSKNPNWNNGMKEGIFDRFKKKIKKPELNLPKWPNSNNANEWMAAKADYYAQYEPESLPNLFSPATGDYLPLSVHVGSSWKPEHQAFYRELKKKYPEAVAKAKDITTGIAGRVSLSRVGDQEDFHNMRIDEVATQTYSARMANITDDLGNGYFLGDDSYDDDDGFTKEGYSVYYREGPDQFRQVGHVNVSPYPRNRKPGEVESEIQKLISQDQGISEDKSGVEKVYDDPETHDILAYAQQHYPEEPDLQAAFVKFVLRSLKHSKNDDERQDNEIELLLKRVNSLQDTVNNMKKEPAQKSEKVDESADYLPEK